MDTELLILGRVERLSLAMSILLTKAKHASIRVGPAYGLDCPDAHYNTKRPIGP